MEHGETTVFIATIM